MTGYLNFLLLLLATTGAPVEQTTVNVAAGAQQVVTPNFAIGDVSAANVDVADYVVSRGRQHLTILGRQPGSTSILLWDQQSRLRISLTVHVARELDPATDAEVRRQIAGWPDVSIGTVKGEPVLTGHVDDPSQLAQVERVATVARIRSMVVSRPRRDPAAPKPQPLPPLLFELELLEAPATFETAVYSKGVVPSGRLLYTTRLSIDRDASGQTFIGGSLGKTRAVKSHSQSANTPIGLRLTLRPTLREGAHVDAIVETNLPLDDGVTGSDRMRTFTQSFELAGSAPFAIAGNDLLAVRPGDESKGPSILKRILRLFRLPGVNDVPGLRDVPAFGEVVISEAYRKGRTQLLLLVRPTNLPAVAGGR